MSTDQQYAKTYTVEGVKESAKLYGGPTPSQVDELAEQLRADAKADGVALDGDVTVLSSRHLLGSGTADVTVAAPTKGSTKK